MKRIWGVVIAVILTMQVVFAGDVSVQVGSGLFEESNYLYDGPPVYAGVTYYPGYIGSTAFRPEADIGFWRTSGAVQGGSVSLGSTSLDHVAGSHSHSDWVGAYLGIRLAIDAERSVREEGVSTVWVSVGAGANLHWARAVNAGSLTEPTHARALAFLRLNIKASDTATVFVEVEGQTRMDTATYSTRRAMGLLGKLGYRFRAF